LLIPLDAVFTEATMDRDLEYKLLTELPGILNLIIKGFQRLNSQGKFTRSIDSEKMLVEYEESLNSVVRWMREVEFKPGDPENFISSKTIYDNYKKFCNDANDRPKSMKHFFSELKRSVPELQPESRWTRRRVGGTQHRGILGFTMEHNEDELGTRRYQEIRHGLIDKRFDS